MGDLAALDAVAQGLSRLPSRYADATRLRALVTALASRAVNLETLLASLQGQRTIETAAGKQLDTLGKLVGQARAGGDYPAGETDALYRIKIRARALRNRSSGTAEDLIGIVAALLPAKVAKTLVWDAPPAAIVVAIQVTAALTADEQAIVREFLLASKAAGVKIDGMAWYIAPTFAWHDFPDPPFRGYDGGAGTGGFWAVYF